MADDINLPNLLTHLQVNLGDTSGVVADATRQGSSVGAALGESLQRRVQAAVNDIPPVVITDDSSQFDRDLDRVRRDLQRLGDQRIGVDISIEDALRQMDRLQPHLDRLAHTHPDIDIRASVGEALANLADLRAAATRVDDEPVVIRPEVRAAPAIAELSLLRRALNNAGSGARGLAGSMAPALATFGLAAAKLGAVINVVGGVVAALQNIVPAASIGATALLAVAQAGAVIKLGTSGIGDAITAAFAPATGAAGGAAAASNGFADAQRGVAKAVEAAALANTRAARAVKDAERDVTDAQKAALDAQKALTQAREDATRELQDMNDSLAEARISERQAVRDVEKAEEALLKVRSTGAADDSDAMRDAILDRDKAVLRLKEQRTETARLAADTTAANKAGVEGSKTYTDAQKGVSDAQREVSDRSRDLADAQADVTRTAKEGAEQIRQAKEALDGAGAAAGGAAGGADAFAEAMAKLSPSARAFVREIIALKPAFDDLKLDVQEKLFKGLDEELKTTAAAVLPAVRKGFLDTAGSLNEMAKGVGSAARDLAKSGTLGQALDSAAAGLHNLVRIPGQIVTAIGQLGAAGGSQFDRLTGKAGEAADRISAKLSAAFADGRLNKAIDVAIDVIGQIVGVVGNVGVILGNIFAPAVSSGGNLIGVLQDITGSIADVTGTKPVQDAFKALFDLMGKIGKTVGPLLSKALTALAPIFTKLGPPAEHLVEVLGDALGPIIDALAPVLEDAAGSVGLLVEAAIPLIPVIGDLAVKLLPALLPLIDGCSTVFEALAPVVQDVADVLGTTLGPILDDLPTLIGPLAELLARNLVFALQTCGDLLVAVAPSLADLGVSLGELLVAVAPLIIAFIDFSDKGLAKATPLLVPLIDLVAKLAAYLADVLGDAVTNVITPALQFLADLLHGRFSDAWGAFKTAASNAVRLVLENFGGLPGKAVAALAGLAGRLAGVAVDAGNKFLAPVQKKIDDAVTYIGDLPNRAGRALGDLGDLLYRQGGALIEGFLRGIRDNIPGVKSLLSSVTDSLPDWKGPAERDARILTPAGRLLIDGFMRGIDLQVPSLQAQLQGLTAQLAGMAGLGPSLAGVPTAGALAASYAGSAAPAAGPTTIHLHGTEATPEGVSAALSWRSKVGRR
ncbi:hypothetical protein [Streptomyces sp. RKAG337]|uniref:hypothetical protein n=1 Tax=Streptomyces sp. RKAG337 TaxID=2893404 RepID=UPI002033DD1E|nr:hypothetical protein [Streptomyces sp. RKAG337]MCM2427389.1 hypothetical protein [Streptomyces sp. RKAG337]